MSIQEFLSTEPNINTNSIVIREVWSYNLEAEFKLIRYFIDQYPCITMDTEFPGVIYHPPANKFNLRRPSDPYTLMKLNVDALNLIQLGLTLSDADGNLPHLDGGRKFIWQFNFMDFDIYRDPYAVDSVELLKRQGIDFERNRVYGVHSALFAELLLSSGLVFNEDVTWVTFHGTYDFGYLVKILTRCELPDLLEEFLEVLRVFFGRNFYDAKHLMRFCPGLYGGLDRVASSLGVNRVVGKGHQAGSDSLLTWHTFHKIRDLYFEKEGPEKYGHVLYGFEVSN